MRDAFLSSAACIAAAALLSGPAPAAQVAPPQPATAPEGAAGLTPIIRPDTERFLPGNVTIAFEGGLVSSDLGKVLAKLAEKDSLLPVRNHVLLEGEDPCTVLKKLGYPPCGADLLSLLDTLNPKLLPSKGKVHQGDTLVLPNVWLRSFRAKRTLVNVVKTDQARSVRIKTGWKGLQVDAIKLGPHTEIVEFDAYQLILASTDAAHQASIMNRIAPLKSANVRVDAIPFAASATRIHALRDWTTYQSDCAAQARPDKVKYVADYIEGDPDAANRVLQRPAGATRARVYLIDLALDPTPNLSGALEGQPVAMPQGGWRCAWIAATGREHATHLASIIASQDNGFGFVGVSPATVIRSFELVQPDTGSTTGLSIIQGRESQLAEDINDQAGTPYVYLVATTFSPFEGAASGQIPAERRFDNRKLEEMIRNVRPLFVVAAGQRSLKLSPTFFESPQNLGDQHNVLVVTACVECTRSNSKIWDQANSSVTGGQFVHVAAPGGQKMLGWVSRSGIGAMNGTSQAAAFTAGILAEMVGRFPSSYASAQHAKKRIQVTAWPVYKGNGNGDDYDRLAAGIVDPNLALLDPEKHWIKGANGWEEVRLKGFTGPEDIKFRTVSDTAQYVPAEAVARIVQVAAGGQSPKYIVYSDAFQRGGALGAVMRDGPLTASPDLALVKCDGTTVALGDLTDVIIANRGFGPRPCAS